MDNLMEIYLQSLAVREDLPEETRDYVEEELERRSNDKEKEGQA